MFIFVNVEKHREVMGEIVTSLVSKYGVPVSIVDSIEKMCPRCTASCSSDDCMKNDETTEPDNRTPPNGMLNRSPKKELSPTTPPKLVSTASSSLHTTSRNSKSPEMGGSISITNGNAKKRRLNDDEIKEEIMDDDDMFKASTFESALIALQNGFREEDVIKSAIGILNENNGASNSSIQDDDNDDYGAGFNPQLLASFISSTPNIFASAASTDLAKLTCQTTPSFPTPANVLSKRGAPPMLTVNGKTRRGRIVYSQNELNILEKYYLENPNACADPAKREEMCTILDVDYHRLKVWFQNRRRKDKIRSELDEDIRDKTRTEIEEDMKFIVNAALNDNAIES